MTVTAVRPPRIADELGELAVRMSAVLLGDHTGGSAVQILTSLSLNAVPNASGAGVTLVGTRGAKTSVAATSEAVLEADALQYHLNQGPCLDACLQAAPVQVADLRLDHRWPAWTKAVRPLNIASLMSIPLVNSGRVQGAIKIYCDISGGFDAQATFMFGELAHTVALLLTPPSPPTD
ncbi:MAG: GAF domain-containing protein [Propionibacteriaceae bacterium]|nr:GAF domain-containing protein [Propionibacteriaceae bacterium]